jgi:nitrate reductase delta subunit
VLAHIGRKLAANGNVYRVVFDVLEQLSPVAAELLVDPPVRDMDEALETFGPGADGVEPLLKNQGAMSAVQPSVHPVRFYPKAARANIDAPATARSQP